MRYRGFRLLIVPVGLLAAGLALAAPQGRTDAELVQPEMTPLVELERCVPESTKGQCARIKLTMELSGIDWLDHALLRQLSPEVSDSSSATLAQQIAGLQQQAADWLNESYATVQATTAADQRSMVSYERIQQQRFVYQRANLAFYRQLDYDYSGGAHGMYASQYLLFDLNTQRRLQLKDIVLPNSETKLATALRDLYLQEYSELAENWLPATEQEQLDAMLVDNFVFTDDGLTFIYPLYQLAPYSYGEVRLKLDSHSLQGLLQPQYSFGYSERVE